MIDQGRASEVQGRAIIAAYEKFASTPHAFQILPTVIEIIAAKK